ncbi:MAG: hypothetical protein M1817_006650 [Caeruleum heppii]|nr:MAG: hypothetical protein M1817_006650 [Caeruleum heppii]
MLTFALSISLLALKYFLPALALVARTGNATISTAKPKHFPNLPHSRGALYVGGKYIEGKGTHRHIDKLYAEQLTTAGGATQSYSVVVTRGGDSSGTFIPSPAPLAEDLLTYCLLDAAMTFNPIVRDPEIDLVIVRMGEDTPAHRACRLQIEPAEELANLQEVPAPVLVNEASGQATYDHYTADFLT